jgi:hypothetical protein
MQSKCNMNNGMDMTWDSTSESMDKYEYMGNDQILMKIKDCV